MTYPRTGIIIINVISIGRGAVTLEKRIGNDGITVIQVGNRAAIIPCSVVDENTAVDNRASITIAYGAPRISDDASLESGVIPENAFEKPWGRLAEIGHCTSNGCTA